MSYLLVKKLTSSQDKKNIFCPLSVLYHFIIYAMPITKYHMVYEADPVL